MKTRHRRAHPFLLPLATLFFLATDPTHQTERPAPTSWASDRPPHGERQPEQSRPGAERESISTTEWSDRRIAGEIKQHLKSRGLLDRAYLAVRVADGMVTLSGLVASPSERRNAIEAAWARTVRHVEASRLFVSPWLHRQGKRSGTNDNDTDASETDRLAPAYRPNRTVDRPERHVLWPDQQRFQ